MDRGVIGSCWRNGAFGDRVAMMESYLLIIFFLGKPRCTTPTFCSLNYNGALSFKELNETHLHIYLYPMSLTSMTGSCRLLCYRNPVEVE